MSEDTPPIAESFLALAKDCRYVAAATHLIVQLLEGWDVAHSPADAWYASALLYAILVLRRKGRTLGMDITGIQYKNLASNNNSAWNHITIRSIAGISVLYCLHRWTRKHGEEQRTTTGLRGSDRMQAFRNRRRAMIQRSQDQSYSTATSSTTTTRDPATASALSQLSEHVRQAGQRLLENFMVYQTGGPHDLSAQQFSAAWWCLRLYAAYYCLDGRFPSIGHLLLRHQVESEPDQKRLANRPRSHRVVALLILSHTAGVVLQSVSKVFLRWLIKKFPSTDRSQVRIQGAGTAEPSNEGICAICQQPRKHPACPIQCGHICCWDCLQKWINFRSECPICRKPSRAQDILALYNYQAPKEQEKDS